MAFDFGNAGLFDPLPPLDSNGKADKKRIKKKRSSDEDDENDNVHSNGDNHDENSPLERGSTSTDEEEEVEDEDPGWPSAPPIDILDSIKGYEMVSFDAISVPPPPFVPEEEEEANADNGQDNPDGGGEGGAGEGGEGEKEGGEDNKGQQSKKIMIAPEIEPKLTEAQARSAMLSHIANHCCYGKAAAKNMHIKKMEYLPAFHYELQTFTEKRETAWTYAAIRTGYESMMGGSLGAGVPPLPWEIFEEPAQAFKDEVRLVQVPNTASTKSCHRCRGTGGVTCRDCNGKGWSRCLNCHGDGWMQDSTGYRERCFYCQHSKHGHGQQDCHKCGSKGKVNCTTCEGHGQIRCFIQLSITWKVNTAEHIIERLDLPTELIRDVSGQVAFEEEAPRVKPVEAFTENQDIKEASASLVFNQLNAFSDHKVIRQRHQVRIVPVTRVTYEWKGKLHVFYVYGYENKSHLPKYPQKCCWGCSIL